jgi:ABC-type multidrug transport system fused ATPase/permease subunit
MIRRSCNSEAEQKEIGSFAFMVRALKMALPHAKLVSLAILCLVCTCAASVYLPKLNGEVLDNVISGDRAAFSQTIKLFILVSLASGCFGALRNLMFNVVGASIGQELRIKLFGTIMAQVSAHDVA